MPSLPQAGPEAPQPPSPPAYPLSQNEQGKCSHLKAPSKVFPAQGWLSAEPCGTWGVSLLCHLTGGDQNAASDRSQGDRAVPGVADAGSRRRRSPSWLGGQCRGLGDRCVVFFPRAFSFLGGSGCLPFEMPFEDGSSPKGRWWPSTQRLPWASSVLRHHTLLVSLWIECDIVPQSEGPKNNTNQALLAHHGLFVSHFKGARTRVYAQPCTHLPSLNPTPAAFPNPPPRRKEAGGYT